MGPAQEDLQPVLCKMFLLSFFNFFFKCLLNSNFGMNYFLFETKSTSSTSSLVFIFPFIHNKMEFLCTKLNEENGDVFLLANQLWRK